MENFTHPSEPVHSGQNRQEQQDVVADEVSEFATYPGSQSDLHRLIESIFLFTLQTLPPQHRAALLLAEFGRFTLPDIAEILQISEESADSMLREARHMLR